MTALASLKTSEEATRFLRDLCTPAEIREFEGRWAAAQLLDKGDLSYRDIAAQIGTSTTTVTRVARFLNDEPHQGYRLVLERQKKSRRGI
ncbi:MAG TPA: YerC/YecD family TrpR-related protein [Alphaproteobacteria bacterium]|nr:YerC/YecD family TrpR-related protein [Alphaproteobacteria bacterium]